MGRMLVALSSIALVDHVFGFNPLPAVSVHSNARSQPRTQSVPNVVVPPRTMPGERPAFLPPMPAGSSGSSFLPPMATYDPALSATQQSQEAGPTLLQEVEEAAWPEPQMAGYSEERINPAANAEQVAVMQADGGSLYRGFAAGIFAGFSAMFLALRSRIQRQSSAAPQFDAVEMRQNEFSMSSSDPSPPRSGLAGAEPFYTASPDLRRALQGAQVTHFSPPNTVDVFAQFTAARRTALRMQLNEDQDIADAKAKMTDSKSVVGERKMVNFRDGDGGGQALFDEKVSAGEWKEAVQLMGAESQLEVSKDQAWRLLDSVSLDISEENQTEQQIIVSLMYAALRKYEVLKGFNMVPVSSEALPLASPSWSQVDVAGLERTLGMSIGALTPKGSSMQMNVNARVLASKHEAGHFLLAYLLGCPIQGFFLSVQEAISAGIRGYAGTVYFDNILSEALKANRLTQSCIDRYTIVLMGGIAAEAMNYQQAVGGANDEAALVNFLTGLSPPWDQGRVFNQALWSVAQAVLLLREHQSAYEKLVEAMAGGESLGACISVIEDQLDQSEELPVTARIRQRSAAAAATAPTPARL